MEGNWLSARKLEQDEEDSSARTETKDEQPTEDLAQRLDTVLLNLLPSHQQHRRSSIVQRRRVRSRDGSSLLLEHRPQAPDLLKDDLLVLLVLLHNNVALGVLDGDGGNLGVELASGPGGAGTLVGLDAVLVLVSSGDGVGGRGLLGAVAHGEVVRDVPETVGLNGVLHLATTKGGKSSLSKETGKNKGKTKRASAESAPSTCTSRNPPEAFQGRMVLVDIPRPSLSARAKKERDSRSVRHALHTTSDDNTPLLRSTVASEHHALGGEGDGLHARSADFVDGRGVGRLRETRTESNLTSRRLTSPGLDDLSYTPSIGGERSDRREGEGKRRGREEKKKKKLERLEISVGGTSSCDSGCPLDRQP
jgi:hypothetical protein